MSRCKQQWSPTGGDDTAGCLRKSTYCGSPDAASFHSGSFFLSTTPRKVSFEDSSPSSGDDDSDSSHHERRSSSQVPPSPTLTRKRSLLRRPKSTMSLVDLAKSAESNEEEDMKVPAAGDEEFGEPRAKRICSPRAGPMTSPRTTLPCLQTAVSGDSADGATPGSSPWGQFVDMLVPEDEDYLTSSSCCSSPHLCYHHLDLNSSASSSMICSCRSRRPSPYSDYHSKTYRARRAMPPPSTLHLQESTFSNPTVTKFRLAPRKTHPSTNDQELLIGALADLNF